MGKKILSITILILILLCNLCVYATDEQTEIPSKYDLRNEISLKVEYQQDKPWCGEYAEIGMIETYLQKTKGINYNLSESYMAYYSDFGGTYGKHVLESDFPNKEYPVTETNQKKFDEATSKAVVESFEYGTSINKDTETIKRYIMNYGGVFSVTMCDKQLDYYKGGMYRSSDSVDNRGLHGVLIIGWDDSYSKDNFVYEKPENDGAWLVLNSWGSNWGNNGYGWVSYKDYYNLVDGSELIESLTLADGETIETKLTDEKQEEQTTETKSDSNLEIIRKEAEQKVLERNKKRSMLTIAYIVTLILFILVIVIKITRHRGKSNKEE